MTTQQPQLPDPNPYQQQPQIPAPFQPPPSGQPDPRLPYGPYPPGYPYRPPAPAARNGFGITALVTGIVGVVLGMIPILAVPALILGLVAVVFGGLALGRVSKRIATNKVMSWFGLGLGAVAIVLAIVGFAIVNKAVNDLNHDLHNVPTPTYSYDTSTP